MEKSLNISAVQSAMLDKGLNQSTMADALGVNRQNVSKWFSGALPRANIALALATLLDLSFEELFIIRDKAPEPIVAFRKKANRQISESYVEKAKDRGRSLSPIIQFLPFDDFFAPDEFQGPKTNYEYIQRAVNEVRDRLGIEPSQEMTLENIIRNFNDQQAVLIPVLWGAKENHENALHIYLPESKTTWIFINLDAEYLDFKFWLAHELAHVYTPSLAGEDAEDFADAFAGALLFPECLAKNAYESIKGLSAGIVVNKIKSYAKKYQVSPITVFIQLKKYCSHHKLMLAPIGNGIYGAAKNMNKDFPRPSELWSIKSPSDLICIGSEKLNSPFFPSVSKYLEYSGKESGYLAALLDLSLVDAKNLQLELV